jgi:hypothetical protein
MASIARPTAVRYIKLGEGGGWERECIERGIIRYGFGTEDSERFQLCREAKWPELTASFVASGKAKGVATRFTNESRLFFEDSGSTLWITFFEQRLFWGFASPEPPQHHSDGNGVWRTIVDGWRWEDINGEPLTKDRLSGALTQLASYRGTSCRVEKAAYIIGRINGQKTPEVENAIAAIAQMKSAVVGLMRLLGPKDFELLVELVFAASGWRRLSAVGNVQKTIDIDIELPSTRERAFVQIKSKTSSQDLSAYIERVEEPYDRMFFVHHSGTAITDDPRVTVVGPDDLAALVVDAGLSDWLVRKVS